MSFAIDSHRENNPYFDYLETEDLVKNNYVQASEWEWQIDPEGLRWRALKLVYRSLSFATIYC